MFKPGRRYARCQRHSWFAVLLVTALLLIFATSPAQAQRPNGAGLVVQHGDGTLIYVYVPFEGDSISGEELLTRSALALEVDIFGGLGLGICSLNGEGCPSDDCFCQSYSDPATFWHYYTWTGTAWVENPLGVSTRVLSDGDIDGWSWNAGSHGLPPVSIDEIANLNGFDRTPPQPTATPTTAPTLAPTPTPIPTATVVAPTTVSTPTATEATSNTSAEPGNAPSPPETAMATTTPTPIATSTTTKLVLTASPSPTATATQSATGPSAASNTTQSTAEQNEAAAPTTTRQATAQAAAVIVTPGETPQPLPVSESSETSAKTTFILFALVFGILTATGLGLVYRSRERSSR